MSKRITRRDKSQKKKSPRRREKPKGKEADSGKTRKSRHQLAKERKRKAERDERLARKRAEDAVMNSDLAGVEGLGVMATAHIYIPIEKNRKKLRVTEEEEGTLDSDEELVREYLSQSSLKSGDLEDEKKESTTEIIDKEEPSTQCDESKAIGSDKIVNTDTGEKKPVEEEGTIQINYSLITDDNADAKQAEIEADSEIKVEEANLEKELKDDQFDILSTENDQFHLEVQKLRERLIAQDKHIESLKDGAYKQRTRLRERQAEFDERLNQRTKNLEEIHLKELKVKVEICRKEAKAQVSDELKELREEFAALKNDRDSKGTDLSETLLAANKALEDEVEQIKSKMEKTKSAMDEIVNSKLQFVQKATAEIARVQQELTLSRLTEFRLQMEIRSIKQPNLVRPQSARKYLEKQPKTVIRSLSAR